MLIVKNVKYNLKIHFSNILIYVIGIMEAISEELRIWSNGKSSVKFTTIYPSLVLTGLIKKPKLK